MHDSSDRISFLGRPVPRGFELRAVTLPPGGEMPYAEAEWEDSLVVVERGQVELECMAGGRRRFRPGDLIWLVGLRLRAVHSVADEPALLVVIRRRTPTDEFPIPTKSEVT